MRTLNDVERKLVDVFLEDTECKISRLLIEACPDLLMQKNDENYSLYLLIPDRRNANDNVAEGLRMTRSIIQVLTLIKTLEKYDYILSSHLAHGRSPSGTMGITELRVKHEQNPGSFAAFPFPDGELHELIYKYWDAHFFPTEALRQYKSKGYKTVEDAQFNTNRNTGIVAIVVSVLLGLVSVWIAIDSSRASDAVNSRLNSLIQRQTDSIISNQKELMRFQITNRADTFNAKKR